MIGSNQESVAHITRISGSPDDDRYPSDQGGKTHGHQDQGYLHAGAEGNTDENRKNPVTLSASGDGFNPARCAEPMRFRRGARPF